MKRSFLILTVLLLMVLATAMRVEALPEYSAQTGEPCASCHASPAGGGPRGPRGQAWVGSGKPGEVPALVDALEILGVRLQADPSAYTTVPDTIAPAQPLPLQDAPTGKLYHWLKDYEGN